MTFVPVEHLDVVVQGIPLIVPLVPATAAGMPVRAHVPPVCRRFPAASYPYVSVPRTVEPRLYVSPVRREAPSYVYSVTALLGSVRRVRRPASS